MFGNDVITRCPYCNQIIAKNIGITQYYKYKNRLVCIDSHCGKQFITEYQSDKSKDFLHRYVIPKSLFGLVTDTKDITMSFLGQNLNEDELTEKVIEQLEAKYDVQRNITSIKTIIQATAANQSTSIYSEPLTDTIKEELVADTTICW